MRLTDKYFWIAWAILALLLCGSMFTQSPGEDTLCLGFAYTLSLLSTWLCHRLKNGIAFYNLAVMIAYNAILSFNLAFNSRFGAGFTWWLLSW